MHEHSRTYLRAAVVDARCRVSMKEARDEEQRLRSGGQRGVRAAR